LATLDPEHARNWEAYVKMASTLRKQYPDEYVGFIDGRFVYHSKDLQDVFKFLEAKEPDRKKCFVERTDFDYERERIIL